MADGAPGRWVCIVSPDRGPEALDVRPELHRPPPPLVNAHGVTILTDGDSVDAGALAVGYRRRGTNALDNLAGTFAIVLWDPGTSTLLAVRDAVGIYPLYYAHSGDAVVISTFVGAVLEQPGVNRDVDRTVAALAIAGERAEIDETLFRGIRRVPPGHALEQSHRGARLFRWWDPGEPDSDRELPVREAEGRFDELFAAAVDSRLEAAGVGIFLSGGIDSAAVAAMSAERSRRRGVPAPVGLALMVDHPDLDEEGNQRTIAGDLGLELISTSLDGAVGPGGLLGATLEVSRSESAGPADIIQPVYDRLARDAFERGRTTVMNGQGGDEWLLPPVLYATDRMRRADVVALVRLWRAWHGYLPQRSPRSEARSLLWSNGLRPLLRATALQLAPVRSRLAGRSLDGLPGWVAPEPALRAAVADRGAARHAAPTAASELYRTARRTLLDRPDRPGLTEAAFASHRRTGVRIAMPLLDESVVRFLYRVPPAVLLEGGRAKALARATIAERLPSFGGGWGRTVSGAAYYGSRTGRELPSSWESAGGVPLLAGLGVVDEEALRAVVQGRSAEGRGSAWAAVNLDVWLRARLDGA